MLELKSINQEILNQLNTKTRVTFDLIKDGKKFLEGFDINHELLPDTVSLIYRFLRKEGKVPHNLYKFYIAAYYIAERHPKAFPVHRAKSEFCELFKISSSSLNYSVKKISSTLELIKIYDELGFPYFLDPKLDLAYALMKRIIKVKVERARMVFLLYHQPLNPTILAEELTVKVIFEMELFPDALFRQFYEIIEGLVQDQLQQHVEYLKLQRKYFI